MFKLLLETPCVLMSFPPKWRLISEEIATQYIHTSPKQGLYLFVTYLNLSVRFLSFL